MGVIKHIVLFHKKPEIADATVKALDPTPLAKIPGVLSLAFGENFETARGKGATHALVMEFANRQDLASYYTDAVHVQFIKEHLAKLFDLSQVFSFKEPCIIGDAGGSFAKKEAAQEDQYAREHDKEVIAKLREQLTKKHQAPAQTPEAAPAAPPSTASSASTTARDHEEKVRFSGAESSHGGSIRAGGGALGKKEAADEERYIKELEKERNARKK
ncbi:hypothetical protein HK101_011261 [Irineochytrium annulatum]|nr:hypothetical protein HK101_011261 [Irineochytrium annulatum]